ncbi:rotatin isoform X1 [Nasonia vitripennis]|uniref:Rotatin N-terminal domain-containing protein n=2 Tax=Nasonia vitripennis TaxID=7425 RepID=A0A7M7H950_NASVI|nr:rotatin isoform X1 [Nasonia vitripennis]
MSAMCTISNAHIKKLDHALDEIRLRALENIISKLNLGFECDCNAVKKELLIKLFKWFTIEPIIEEEKVLNLLIKLLKSDSGSYLNSFGKIRLQNELRDLRARLDSKWHDKLNVMEEIVSKPDKFIQHFEDVPPLVYEPSESNYNQQYQNYPSKSSSFNAMSPLDCSAPFELTVNCVDGAVIPRRSESSVKWLCMPWQVLAKSDKNVLTSLKNSFNDSPDIATKIESCRFITNILLQDFPAEVFLQRPTTVNILLDLLQSYKDEPSQEGRINESSENLIIEILKILYKLTRSLRFRIYYYCDPSIAHKAQKILSRNLQNQNFGLPERDSPDGEPPDQNYHGFQTTRPGNRSPSVIDDVDDSVLQLQQKFIPHYCTETLIHVLKLLSIPNNPTRPLKIVRLIADLAYELVQLLITSVMPTVWFCNDNVALKIHDNVKTLFEMLGEILDYFEQFNSVDYYRTTYIFFLWISVKLISNIMPLELADQVIPKNMKLCICNAIMDAPIYLMYSSLHVTLQEYARRFHGTQECAAVKLLDETRLVTKSMKAAISLIKFPRDLPYSEELRIMYLSKLSLLYHKNFKMIRKFVSLAQNRAGYNLSTEDKETTTKMMLSLLAHNDDDVQEATYTECQNLVAGVLGIENNGRYSWKNLLFLMEPSVLTEIICHGTTNENKKIKSMADDILLHLLKGKFQMGESGWITFLEALIPVLPLLQCLAHPSSNLGKSITKILDPDVSSSIKLPFIEVLKGNIRLLFSPIPDIRDEALCRLFWLLGQEKNASQKLPRLTSLHGLPFGSLCVFDKQTSAKRSEGTYQRSALISVLEMLRSNNIEPKMRKSALVQVSVMLSDSSLHKLFISENGLPLILDIFSKALIEKDFVNYPDSVISIVTILKLLASSEASIRMELSNRIDLYYNVLRSLFLYPNNESVKMDSAQLLALLLYNTYIMRLTERSHNNPFNISLPYLITITMKLPFTCKAHWKASVHRRSDISILHRSNPVALMFIRQFWAWEWNGHEEMLWKKWENINDPMITETLMIRETELACMTNTSLFYCIQQQLYNIQNSIMHNGVMRAIDYLTMYFKLCNLLNYVHFENVARLPWSHTFERFLQCQPTCKEDQELLVNLLNFLHLYIKFTLHEDTLWLCKTVKSMMKSLSDWLQSGTDGSEDIHQSMLKLVRACSMIDCKENNESKNSWIFFIQFAVANLDYGEFYNLAFLDWILSTLIYVIGKCQWKNHKDTLVSVGKSLNQLILSFRREGTVTFMASTIVRNCIICLNHVLYQMQINLNKNILMKFWYDEGQALSWLPELWKSRDPLVRASALQLLASLINGPHTSLQLLNAIDLSPGALCHWLLYFVTTQEESCIVKEAACLAMSNLIRNSNSIVFQYVDTLKPSAMLSYIKESNVYHEIAVMCSNYYMLATLDPDMSESTESEGTQTQSLASSRTGTTVSMVPKTIYYLYNCSEDFQKCSVGNSINTDDEDQMQFIATPSLITSLCSMLNNLIAIGEHEVIHEIFEHSLHKYIIGCFDDIPKTINGERNLEHYTNILEMYTNLCTVLTNCVIHSPDFASIVIFSPDFIRHLFELLNDDLYFTNNPRLAFLQNQLGTEIFKFLLSLSQTENQHFDSIQTALESCDTESFVKTMCNIIKSCKSDFGMSALGFLAFLLSQEMQKECEENKATLIKEVLDTKQLTASNGNDELQAASNASKSPTKSARGMMPIEHPTDYNKNVATGDEVFVGADICKVLINLFIGFQYTKTAKKSKQSSDKDVVTVALTNLLCVSTEAKKLAIMEQFPATCLMVLKEIYVKLNSVPIQTYKSQTDREQKMHPLLHEIDSIYILLMNFMYDSTEAKEVFAKAGLADIIHKLWAHTSMNKKILINTLKLLSTFTSNYLEAAQSLSLTTVTPGVGLRKTPNSVSLIHVIVQLVSKEIEMNNCKCDCQKLNFAFHILRNAIRNHECRVVISKTNLLQFFTKIHPSTTKRTKIWQIVEINCLEFLIDFTFYDEGQLSVSKAVDGLEVLITLARLSTGSSKLLAISILRNLAFNASNRSRLLGSAEFLELLLTSLKEGSCTEIEVAGSTLWSLVSNNQKGKLIARSSGFGHCIQTAISRLQLQQDGVQEQDLVKMLEYVLQIISPR